MRFWLNPLHAGLWINYFNGYPTNIQSLRTNLYVNTANWTVVNLAGRSDAADAVCCLIILHTHGQSAKLRLFQTFCFCITIIITASQNHLIWWWVMLLLVGLCKFSVYLVEKRLWNHICHQRYSLNTRMSQSLGQFYNFDLVMELICSIPSIESVFIILMSWSFSVSCHASGKIIKEKESQFFLYWSHQVV